MPGKDWVYGLLERHKNEISQKIARNIKRCRANVSRDTIDDPGKKNILFKRGTKYPEHVCNFTKTAITVMMCSSASRVLLPTLFTRSRSCGSSGQKWDIKENHVAKKGAAVPGHAIIEHITSGLMPKHLRIGLHQPFCRM
nr:unnamed protein product [Callosobruchus analis]